MESVRRSRHLSAVNFFFDSTFTRSEGTQFRTPFHQDEPYWSVEGFQCSSAWMPLDPVERRSSLEFVRGSHRSTARYRQQNFGAEPGDVAIFNARMIHGGSGLLADDRQLRVFNTQWLGDDVCVRFRAEGMDPDHSQLMIASGLNPGDRVGGALYPEVWRQSAASSKQQDGR